MKKVLSMLLALAMIVSLVVPSALAADAAPKVIEATVAWPVVAGSEEVPANEARFYHYVPADFKFRGNSTPVIFVLGDGAWTEASANEALTRGGFDQMADDESGHIVFVSPVNGKTWTADDYAVMQALATDITDDYFYQEDLQGLYDSGFAPDGRMYAGRFRSYTFAEGSAQAFVKKYLDTPDATYWVSQWNNTVDGFGAGFHYADKFTAADNLKSWENLRRTNRLCMMDGVSYIDRYSVYADYGIDETLNDFKATSGKSFEYYQYIPKSVDLTSTTAKYPLVFVFHGNGQHPDGYMHLMDWPVTGDKYGFITVAVNANQDNADLLEFLDSLIAKYPIDPARVYSTGYSMGGLKSWSLGFDHTERFAAIAPTEAIPGMVGSNPPTAAPTRAPSQKLPVFYVPGECDFFPLFPMNNPATMDVISTLSKVNGFAYDGTYNEDLDQYFGMKFDRTYTYERAPATHDGAGIWTIRELDDENGVPYTILSSVSKLGHSAFMPEPERIWQFFSHFTRGADGASVYTATPCADVPAKSWYTDAVVHALDNGLMTTRSDTFHPTNGLTADELADALYALAGKPEAERAAAWANTVGLPVGSKELTRGEAADAMQLFAKSHGLFSAAAPDLSLYIDGSSASEGILWAVGAGILTGKPGGLLDGESIVSRAEAALMLQRLHLLDAK